MSSLEGKLLDTRQAFDGVAAEYDGPSGNNEIVQRFRHATWRVLTTTFPVGSRLLDLGCGTGLDLAELTSRGYRVVGVDWSPSMVSRTRSRIVANGLGDRARAEILGIQELASLVGEKFDGIYSNFGALNCVADPRTVSLACRDLLVPGGRLVASVIGRVCPWEIVYYAAHLDRANATRRLQRGQIPVGLQGQTVWTRYYLPREFAREFAADFDLSSYRSLGFLVPPPYLAGWYRRFGRLGSALDWLDQRLSGLTGVRDVGDHFLMVLTRRDQTRGHR